MDYILEEEDNKVILEFLHEDNRPGAVQEEPQGKENPMVVAKGCDREQRQSLTANIARLFLEGTFLFAFK